MIHRAPAPSQRGMMLLEVMLAAAIFALAGIALATALDRLSKTYVEARRIGAVRVEIASRLAQARFLPLLAGKDIDRPDARGVSYEEEKAPLPMENDDHTQLPGFWRVTVVAHWKEGEISQEERGEIYVFQ